MMTRLEAQSAGVRVNGYFVSGLASRVSEVGARNFRDLGGVGHFAARYGDSRVAIDGAISCSGNLPW